MLFAPQAAIPPPERTCAGVDGWNWFEPAAKGRGDGMGVASPEGQDRGRRLFALWFALGEPRARPGQARPSRSGRSVDREGALSGRHGRRYLSLGPPRSGQMSWMRSFECDSPGAELRRMRPPICRSKTGREAMIFREPPVAGTGRRLGSSSSGWQDPIQKW